MATATTPPAAIGGDELAKALRDAYGQGCRHAVGTAPEYATGYREKRDAWIRQYMARLAPAVGAGGDPLTAAAPDMLAALRDIVDLCAFDASGDAFRNGVTDSTGTIDEGDARASSRIAAARAAIAKAGGG